MVRAALPCLSHILSALDPADWPAASQPFTVLLRFCIDARPKVRRRAQSGLVDVLAALQRTAAIADASALVVKGAALASCGLLSGGAQGLGLWASSLGHGHVYSSVHIVNPKP